MQARQDRLERLFLIDGRNKPEHPHYATFTGLHQKYDGLPSPRSEDIPA